MLRFSDPAIEETSNESSESVDPDKLIADRQRVGDEFCVIGPFSGFSGKWIASNPSFKA